MANDMIRALFSPSRWRGHWRLARPACLLALLAFACEEPGSGPSAGSNSNWLLACSSDRDCQSGVACHCGGCTRECGSDADCSGLDNARCAADSEGAYQSQCRAEPATSRGICLPRCEPGACGAGRACVSGACVLATLPSSELCLSVATDD